MGVKERTINQRVVLFVDNALLFTAKNGMLDEECFKKIQNVVVKPTIRGLPVAVRPRSYVLS